MEYTIIIIVCVLLHLLGEVCGAAGGEEDGEKELRSTDGSKLVTAVVSGTQQH